MQTLTFVGQSLTKKKQICKVAKVCECVCVQITEDVWALCACVLSGEQIID